MCSRPVGRIPLNTRLFFPSAPVSNLRLLVLVAFVFVLHFCIKSFFKALYELEPFDRLFARVFNRSSVKHRHHGLAPVPAGVIQRRIDCAGTPVGVTERLDHRLRSHVGGIQYFGQIPASLFSRGRRLSRPPARLSTQTAS